MDQLKSQFEFLEPWWSTDEQGAHFHEVFLNQLKTEVGRGHEMFGIPVRVVGRDGGSDATLFELLDGSGRLALVHLTWAKTQERHPWPITTFFPNFDAFASEIMIPQNREYEE